MSLLRFCEPEAITLDSNVENRISFEHAEGDAGFLEALRQEKAAGAAIRDDDGLGNWGYDDFEEVQFGSEYGTCIRLSKQRDAQCGGDVTTFNRERSSPFICIQLYSGDAEALLGSSLTI